MLRLDPRTSQQANLTRRRVRSSSDKTGHQIRFHLAADGTAFETRSGNGWKSTRTCDFDRTMVYENGRLNDNRMNVEMGRREST